MITDRTPVRTEWVPQPGQTEPTVEIRTWSATVNGVRHTFRAYTLRSGERRYSVDRYNGYCDDGTEEGRRSAMRFGCAWSRRAYWTLRTADRSER